MAQVWIIAHLRGARWRTAPIITPGVIFRTDNHSGSDFPLVSNPDVQAVPAHFHPFRSVQAPAPPRLPILAVRHRPLAGVGRFSNGRAAYAPGRRAVGCEAGQGRGTAADGRPQGNAGRTGRGGGLCGGVRGRVAGGAGCARVADEHGRRPGVEGAEGAAWGWGPGGVPPREEGARTSRRQQIACAPGR